MVNFLTLPGETVSTAKNERELHPRAWPASYIPRAFANLAIRLGSSVNDMIVMPWFVWATKDKRPLTYFFDLPDYSFQKL